MVRYLWIWWDRCKYGEIALNMVREMWIWWDRCHKWGSLAPTITNSSPNPKCGECWWKQRQCWFGFDYDIYLIQKFKRLAKKLKLLQILFSCNVWRRIWICQNVLLKGWKSNRESWTNLMSVSLYRLFAKKEET